MLPYPPCLHQGRHPLSYRGAPGPLDIQEVGTAFPFPGWIRPGGGLPRLTTPSRDTTRSAEEPPKRVILTDVTPGGGKSLAHPQ